MPDITCLGRRPRHRLRLAGLDRASPSNDRIRVGFHDGYPQRAVSAPDHLHALESEAVHIFREVRVAELNETLIVARVEDSIAAGRAMEEWDASKPGTSRNRLQTVTLLDAIEHGRFDAAFGGARRDEERARAKERIFSFRDDFGQWDPRAQRPELWNLYNGRIRRREHVRVFPLSNWTELDVWHYIEQEQLELPSIYFAHDREVFE